METLFSSIGRGVKAKLMSEKRNLIFKAIADPTRREIFHLLVVGTALSISQLSTHFEMSRQGVSKHIKLLEEAQMIEITPEGRERYCKAIPETLKELKEWLSFYDAFWDNKLGDLGDYLDQQK